jgi:hypothetical protein
VNELNGLASPEGKVHLKDAWPVLYRALVARVPDALELGPRSWARYGRVLEAARQYQNWLVRRTKDDRTPAQQAASLRNMELARDRLRRKRQEAVDAAG